MYGLTLTRLVDGLGKRATVADLDAGSVKSFLEAAYAGVAPATWNRNLATLRSFFAFCRRQEWLVGDPTAPIERQRVSRDETRAIPY